MKNNTPFKILLDNHDYECFMLYCVVRSLFVYPAIDLGSDEGCYDVNGKLYASAFAGICSHYLVDYTQMYPHDDFEGFVQEMEFSNDKEKLISIAEKHGLDTNLSLDKLVWALLQKYRSLIITDINKLFNTHDLKLRLFGSIFEMDVTLGYQPSFSLYEEHPGISFLR